MHSRVKANVKRTLVQIAANEYVECRTGEDVWVGNGRGLGRVAREDVVGRLIHRRYVPPSSVRHRGHVDALIDSQPESWPWDCAFADVELDWPLARADVLSLAHWDRAIQHDRNLFELQEAPQIEAICSSLVPRLGPGAYVLDLACSHGGCLAELQRRRSDLRLVGCDLSAEMVAHCRARLPTAALTIWDSRSFDGFFAAGFDAIVSRAYSLQVMTRSDALDSLRAAMGLLKPGGYLVVHSLLPPVLTPSDLQGVGRPIVQSRVDEAGLSPFYLLRAP